MPETVLTTPGKAPAKERSPTAGGVRRAADGAAAGGMGPAPTAARASGAGQATAAAVAATTAPAADGQAAAARPTAEQQQIASLTQLLSFDSRLRTAEDDIELVHMIVNDAARLLGASQTFIVRLDDKRRGRVEAVSSMALVDRDTPLIRWIEGIVARLGAEAGLAAITDFALPRFAATDGEETGSYPFRSLLWVPLAVGGGVPFAGLLLARDHAWGGDDQKRAGGRAEHYVHAFAALRGQGLLAPRRALGRRLALAAAVAAVLAGAIPVPLTTLAPVEIVAAEPEIVTASIDGVIKEIPVPANHTVEPGAVLFRYDDTVLTNRLEIAEREMRVAQSRYERTAQAALSDSKARHDLLIAKTEFELKTAERDYARRLSEKAVVTAGRAGLLIYTSRDDWLGRPVTTGEKIMSIADPGAVEARIELPVSDAIVLGENAAVRLYLDAAPLDAISARTTTGSYQAETNSTNQLVYTLRARLDGDQQSARPRIGARGTAQVFGEPVPLAFFLMRRPISFLRQTIGL